MKRALYHALRNGLLLCALFCASHARAQRVASELAPIDGKERTFTPGAPRVLPVRVIDRTGDLAYIEPGARQGLSAGQIALFGKRRFAIVSASAWHASIAVAGQQLAIGETGKVATDGHDPDTGLRRASAPLAAFAGQWPQPTVPADQQQVQPVPLGPTRAAARTELVLSQRNAVVIPIAGDPVRGLSEFRGRLRTEPWESQPFALRADASYLLWWAENASIATPPAQVRELELRYGRESNGQISAGRMRSAAPSLGTLDGARAQSPQLGAFALGAFGGLDPDPLDAGLRTDALHFGADMQFWQPDSALAPYAALVADATSFEGRLDERRLSLLVGLTPGPARVSGGVELSLFPDGNPFRQRAADISFAHADAAVRAGPLDLGARFSTYLPAQSRRLLAEVDPTLLCEGDIAAAGCSAPYPRRYTASGDIGVGLGAVRIDAVATAVTLAGEDLFDSVFGQLGLRVLDPVAPSGSLRESGLQLAAFGTRDPLLWRTGVRIGLDARFALPVELGAAYEPALMRYVTDTQSRVVHGIELFTGFGIGNGLHFALLSQALLGDDVNALYLMSVLELRP